MRMPQPMWRDISINSCSSCCSTHDPHYLTGIEMPAPATGEHRRIIMRLVPDGEDRCLHRNREQNAPRAPSLTHHRDLTPAISVLEILPSERNEFTHTDARGVEHEQHDAIPRIRLHRDHPGDLSLPQDSLRQCFAQRRQSKGSGSVKWQVANPVPPGEQALDRRQLPVSRCQCQVRDLKLIRVLLEVTEGDAVKRLLDSA